MTARPKGNEPQATWEDISPEIAGRLLASSPGNRRLRSSRIKRQAEDMKAGRFQMNGETLKIDTDGALRDGHHRLHAVVLAGVTVRMLVVRGVKAEAIKTVDSGSARTPGDRLTMDGERNTNNLASALRWQIRYEQAGDNLPSRGTIELVGEDVFVALAAHPHMRDAASRAHKYKLLKRWMKPGLLTFCLYNTPLSDEFWESLEGGLNLTAGSPVVLLRQRLERNANSKAQLQEEELLAITIKAHNAWATRMRLTTLRWRNQGSAIERFPRWMR